MPSNPHHGRGGGTLVTVLVGLGVLAIVIWLVVVWNRGTAAPPSDGREIAEPFLESIRGDRVDAAWESTTAEFKSDMGRESFRRFVSQHPTLKDTVEFTGFEVISLKGLSRPQCSFQTKPAQGAPVAIRVLLAREQDAWKVERLIVE
jgi:hypothetical protein